MVLGMGRDEQGRPLLVVGLEEGNIERLKAGQPILRNLAELGIPHLGSVLIVWGQTTADIERDLAPGMHPGTRRTTEADPS